VVALNALSASRCVRRGQRARPRVVRVGDFSGSRPPLERASCESELSRGWASITIRTRAELGVTVLAAHWLDSLRGHRT
jgi:hypothetical protein